MFVELMGTRNTNVTVLLAITWDPPYKQPSDIPPISKCKNFDEPFYRLHATGPYISYSVSAGSIPLLPNLLDPAQNDNGVYHLFEPAGIARLFKCFDLALGDVGLNRRGVHSNAAVAAVEDYLSNRASMKQDLDDRLAQKQGRSISHVHPLKVDRASHPTLNAKTESTLAKSSVSVLFVLYGALLTLISTRPFSSAALSLWIS